MSINGPVIPQIKDFKDVKTALDNIRNYFQALANVEAPVVAQGKTSRSPVLSGINLTSADVVLSPETIYIILEVTTGSATHFIIAPNSPQRQFIVVNHDASHSVTIKPVGGTGVTIPASSQATVYCNGIDYYALSQAGNVMGPGPVISSDIVEFDGGSGQHIKDGNLSHANVADAVTKAAALTITSGKTLEIDNIWILQALATGETGNILDTTKHVAVTIEGTPVKLAVIA